MPSFECRIGMADGSVAQRTVEAPNEDAVRRDVARQGGHIFAIKPVGAGGARAIPGLAKKRSRGARVSIDEFLVFNQELVALLKAGLPVVAGFDILIERQENAGFKAILQDVKEQITSGTALSDAFASHGDVFPRLYSSSLKAGERSGEVEQVLRRYLSYQKVLGAVRRKVTGALVYPAVLIGLSIGLVVILMTYVIPKFTEFYGTFGGELPILTRIVVGIANFMKAHIVELAIGFVILWVSFSQWKATEGGARAWDGFILRIPLVGKILHMFALSQFSRSLATLVGAGTPLVPALDIAGGSIANRSMSAAVASVVPKVREGAELWRTLEGTGQFTSLAVEMVKVGEATGALEDMLENVSEFYDDAIESALQKLINLIEPIILIVMGAVIATILLSVYLPMFSILSNIKT